MARMVFIPFPETGHLYASFKLARQLKSHGHEVYYIGIQDFEEPVRRQGFEFWPMFEGIIPQGFLSQKAANSEAEPFEAILFAARKECEPADLLAQLTLTLENLDPDIVIVDLLLFSVALLAQRLEIATVLLNTQFYDPWEDVRKAAGYGALRNVPELVLCPREFDFPRAQTRENCRYVEASIDEQRTDVSFPWHRLRADKSLIYCSFGSQSHLIRGAQAVLQAVINAISARSECQLVLTTGTHLNPEDFGDVGDNVILVNRAPQLDMLKRTSIMITHGGFNTVKECIFHGVPMMVFPLIRDHPAVAARVVHHGLGLRGAIQQISVKMIHSMIEEIEANASFRSRCSQMQKYFRQHEEAGNAVKVVLSAMETTTERARRLSQSSLPQDDKRELV